MSSAIVAERPTKKKCLHAREKRELQKAAWEELHKNPQPSLENIFEDLGNADANNDKDALVKAADALKDFFTGKLNLTVYGRRDLEDKVQDMMREKLRPFVEPAKHDIKKRLRIEIDVMEAWNFIAKAGIALTKLNRAKRFSDGTRAYQILYTYVEQVIFTFTSYKDSSDGICNLWELATGGIYGSSPDSLGDFWKEARAAVERSSLTAEQLLELEDDIRHEKVVLSRRFVRETQDAYGVAVRKAREEQKKHKKMIEAAGEREDDLAKSCWLFAECGYGQEAGGDGLGFDLFDEARTELKDWSLIDPKTGKEGSGSFADDEW